METECPHTIRSDDDWMRRMRFHQSWYRHNRLRLRPGPYGNHLLPEDGDNGRNFLNEDIYAVALERLKAAKGAVEPKRLRRNLLSSQPMCFNLLAPLRQDLGLATHFLRSLLPDASRKVQALLVELEFAPHPRNVYLNDRTAFDAFIEYGLADGRHGFVGVEVKLTERFSERRYALAPNYDKWCALSGGWWLDPTNENFGNIQFNQLWRDHLLAFSMLHQTDTKYDEGYCAVLYHDRDSSCPGAIAAYRKQLNDSGQRTLLEWPLSRVVRTIESVPGCDRAWSSSFRERYLSLHLSDDAYNAYDHPGYRRRRK